jgi:bifunctional DNA-binding transcriptional regulator/antitoxin component of YhaV-PrlF toxin-antitoxin module
MGQKRRHSTSERVAAMAAELRSLGRPASRAELEQALPKELFPNERAIDRTFREDQAEPQPVLEKLGRNRYALRATGTRQSPEASPPTEQSRVYERGQTVVPKAIRDAMALEQGSTLVWEMEDGMAKVMAVPKDAIWGAIGILKGKGPTFEEFIADRNAERERERKLEADEKQRWRTYSTRRLS